MEDAYESCVGPNDANLDSFSMMKWIERIHKDLNRQMDNLPREIVQACEKEGFRQETKAIKEAEDAARKVGFKLLFFRSAIKIFLQYLKHFLILIALFLIMYYN